jgi:putative salt-induced outer membrane protein YdiY
MTMRVVSIGVFAGVALLALAARADELRFKNGDRFTGTVISMAEGQLVFASVLAGKVTLPMADLETFSTDGPVMIEFDDGTRLQQAVQSSEPGRFRTATGGQEFVLARATRINPEPQVWHGAIAAGSKVQRGNSITQSANVDFSARLRRDRDRTSFGAGYLGSRQTEENEDAPDETSTTQRRAFGSAQYDYFFTKKLYGYTRLNYERDGVALLDMRFIATPGVGWQVWESPERSLAFETGISWVREEFSDDTEDDDFFALRNAWNLDHALIGRLRFFHTGEWLPALDLDSHLVKTSTGLRTPLTDRWFLEGKVLFDWDSDPADDADRRDLTYLLSVGWSY